MIVRVMQERDLHRVVAIESSVAEVPWPMSQFTASYKAGHDCYVVEQNGRIHGFTIWSRVVDEATLLNVAVSRSLQSQGVGRMLVKQGLQQQRSHNVRHFFLEVRESNLVAQQLYTSLGFNVVGRRKDYYPTRTGREDGFVMSLSDV